MRLLAPLVLLFLPIAAAAQQSQYFYPVEPAALESRVDLQLEYAQPGADPTVHRTLLSVEGQYVVVDRLEIALTLALLDYSFSDSDDPPSVPLYDARLGDPILGLKLRTSRSERLSSAAFLDTRLPLHSGPGDRRYAVFQGGAAVGLTFPRLALGGTVELLWFLRTVNEELGTSGHDVAYFGLGLHAGYRVFGPLWARLALQFYNSMHPDGGIQILGLSPGFAVELLDRLSIELSTRIAPTDESRDFFGGRATLMLAAGWRFGAPQSRLSRR